MEKKFNIGDRVRFKGDYLQYVEDAVSNGGEYLITDVGHDSSEVTLHCPVFIDNDDLELVESYDPKTAFLSELKGLLEKYGAKMSADVSGPDLDCAEIDMLFLIGDDEIRFDVSMFNSFITLDNIIESACYDKE